ncbi:MFS transporter [Chitinophaga sp. GCM10012297]|uniref:MFS transporter n=1 Tax=Chitinophaga chungangae TaxID=2821488 RepID=A0ABS3YBW8_9BACT|nr:MFS transporter [Chitinophaga chungangae]MBO9152160.1 MFS transporter [Chitinophaga chungangae]
MAAQNAYFHPRFNGYTGLVRLALIFILFAGIAQFASFGIIQAHVISYYGAQPEDVTFAFQITYVGIITTLPVQFRTYRFFNTRRYLVIAFLAGILLNTGCLLTQDLVVFTALRFLTGVVTCIIAGCMLLSIFTTLPEPKRMLVGISIFFPLILAAGLIVGIGASWAVERMDWTAMYYGLIALQVLAMPLCVIVFKEKPDVKPYPLYQVDWFGAVLFMFGAAAAAFVMIYGPKRYWLNDREIRNAVVSGVIMTALFLYRQATVKRPLIHLSVFRHGKFVFAILLMVVFYGARDSINLLYGYSAGILGWSAGDIVNAGMFNVAGVVLGTLVAVKVILVKKQNLPFLLLGGFALMAYYHFWVHLHITPDLSFAQISIPVFLQGLSCGLLFVPITVFCMASIPQTTGMTGIVVCTYARFAATLNSISGFNTLQLNYNQRHRENLSGNFAAGNELLSQRLEFYKSFFMSKGYSQGETTGLSNALVAKSAGVQSQLLTIREIFYLLGMCMAATVIVLIGFAVVSKIKTAKVERLIDRKIISEA